MNSSITHSSHRTRRLAIVTTAIVTIGVGCGGDTSQPVDGGADGASLYASSCASCHGGDLRGTDQGPSQLSIVYEPDHHGDDAYRSAVSNGARQHHWAFGDMPAITGLSDDDVESIIAFIRDSQEREGFESYPP